MPHQKQRLCLAVVLMRAARKHAHLRLGEGTAPTKKILYIPQSCSLAGLFLKQNSALCAMHSLPCMTRCYSLVWLNTSALKLGALRAACFAVQQ